MEGTKYWSGRDHILVGDRGVELQWVGRAPIAIPWTSIGLLRVEEVDDGSAARHRALCAHLSDGRRLPFPAPRSDGDHGSRFDAQAAEILKAWRTSYLPRVAQPRDAVPADYRRSMARDIDLADKMDAVPIRTSPTRETARRWSLWRRHRPEPTDRLGDVGPRDQR